MGNVDDSGGGVGEARLKDKLHIVSEAKKGVGRHLEVGGLGLFGVALSWLVKVILKMVHSTVSQQRGSSLT
jgi:hypothetical protein